LPGYVYFGLIDPVSAQVYWLNPKLNIFIDMFNGGAGLLVGIGVVLAGVLLAVLAAASVRALGGSRALLLLGAVPGCIGITLFTAIYWENVFRFTLPALPIFSVLAGWGISVLWKRYSAGPRTV